MGDAESDLRGKGALVTGGGRGIGRAIALALHRQGVEVAVLARTEGEVRDTAELLGPRGAGIVGDVADPASVRAGFGEAQAQLGRVDILVNAAGMGPSAPFLKHTLEEFRRVLDVNLVGAFLFMKEAIEPMIDRGWGRVINIASITGLRGYRYTAAYCASKHGLVGLTRSVALELVNKGVTVNALCPGFVDTQMVDESARTISQKSGVSHAEAKQSLAKLNPIGRLITPEEVAAAVIYLCHAAAVTGAAVPLDGGALI